jgi:uncharacterized protein (TIGR03437 family)
MRLRSFLVPRTILLVLPLASTQAADVHTLTTQATSGSVVTVTTVGISANDLIWDPNRVQIYLSIPGSAGAQGNSITVLNPSTGQLGASAFAGSEPDLLSVSATGQYLYVSLDGSNTVQRMTLPGLGRDIQIPLVPAPTFGPFAANDVEASPTLDRTFLATLHFPLGSSPQEAGVAIFDDATVRPNTICGAGALEPGCVSEDSLVDHALWKPDGNEVYGYGSEFTLFESPVTLSGFGTVTTYYINPNGFFIGSGIHYDPITKYMYIDNGNVVNPASGTTVGAFALPKSVAPNTGVLMVPDGSLGLAFFLFQGSTGVNQASIYTIESFDINRLTPIAAVTIPNATGLATHFIRWGSNGLAFTTSGTGGQSSGGAVYLISGPFVGSTQGPSLVSGGVLNAASFAKDANGNGTAVAPGSLVQIYGNYVGANPQTETTFQFPSTLGGVSVAFNSVPAPLSLVSPFGAYPFVNAQVPFETLAAGAASGVASVVVTVNGVPSAPQSIPILPVAPGIFTIPPTGQGNAVLVFQDPADGVVKIAAPVGSLSSPTAPVPRGQSAFFYATGLGALTPSVPDGTPGLSATQDYYANSTPTVLVGGVTAQVQFAGQAPGYPGVNQINITVPENAPVGNAISIQIVSADGTTMSNTATVAVR